MIQNKVELLQCSNSKMEAHRVCLNGQALELNGKEYELLLLFMDNPGKILRKEYIFNKIWGSDSFSENQTLTVHVKMLRGKIESLHIPDRKHPV